MGTDLIAKKLIDIFAVADMVDLDDLYIFANFVDDLAFGVGPRYHAEIFMKRDALKFLNFFLFFTTVQFL